MKTLNQFRSQRVQTNPYIWLRQFNMEKEDILTSNDELCRYVHVYFAQFYILEDGDRNFHVQIGKNELKEFSNREDAEYCLWTEFAFFVLWAELSGEEKEEHFDAYRWAKLNEGKRALRERIEIVEKKISDQHDEAYNFVDGFVGEPMCLSEFLADEDNVRLTKNERLEGEQILEKFNQLDNLLTALSRDMDNLIKEGKNMFRTNKNV